MNIGKKISKYILGVRVDFGLKMADVIKLVETDLLKDGKNHYICTTNPEFIVDAQANNAFKKIINESSLSVPDGSGVLFAYSYLECLKKYSGNFFFPIIAFFTGVTQGIFPQKMGETITGVSLVDNICALSNEKNYSIFLLGGRPKDAFGKHTMSSPLSLSDSAREAILLKYPNANIIGSTSDYNRDSSDDIETISYIQSCLKKHNLKSLDFLFVAYNHYFQEDWIVRNSHKVPAKVSVGVGGTFDYIAGYKKGSPTFIKKLHLEWLYRLLTQPWRFKRVAKAFPIFPILVFRDALKNSA